jgi:hypothetical protein
MRLAGLKTRHYRDGGRLAAEEPHAVGEDDGDGEEDDEDKGRRVVGEDGVKRVHGGVEDDHGEKVGAGTVVEPGEDDGDGDEEDDAEEQVIHQSKPEWLMGIERGVPERPGEPNEETGEERRKTLLEARKKETAPAGFFEGGGEKEVAQERDAGVGGREPNGVTMLRPHEWLMEKMGDGGGDEQHCGPEEKRRGLPTPIAGMNERVEEFTDAGVAREGARENPRGNRGEESDKQIVGDRRRSVDAAEFVVGDVDGPGKKPKHSEGEKTRGEAVAGAIVATARKEDGGECWAGDAEGGNIFPSVRSDAKMLRGEPDHPGEDVGQYEVEPDLSLHVGREISSNGKDGNRNRRG